MTVTAIRTPLIRPGSDVAAVLAAHLPAPLPDRCVVVVASKICSVAEGRLTGRADDREALHDLVRREAEYYLEPHASRYDIMLTIKGNWMFVNAGIDQSNAAGQLAPWPSDPQRSANELWRRLRGHAAGEAAPGGDRRRQRRHPPELGRGRGAASPTVASRRYATTPAHPTCTAAS